MTFFIEEKNMTILWGNLLTNNTDNERGLTLCLKETSAEDLDFFPRFPLSIVRKRVFIFFSF